MGRFYQMPRNRGGRSSLGAPCELLDLPLRRVEPRQAEAEQLLAALPERDRLVEAGLAPLEPLDDRARALSARSRRSSSLTASPRPVPPNAALRELDVDPAPRPERRGRAQLSVVGAHDRVAALERRRAARARAEPAPACSSRASPALEQERRAAPSRRAASPRGACRARAPAACRARARRGCDAPSRSRSSGGERLARAPRALDELAEQLLRVGDDELAGGSRRRGADVGGEVAERRVLLVPDRRDDGHGAAATARTTRSSLNGQQVLEAPAAAREDDHVDAGLALEALQRVHDAGAARAAPGRASPRPARARAGSGSWIAASTSRLAAASLPVTTPIRRGNRGSGACATARTVPRRRARLEPFERGEVRAEPEALDRRARAAGTPPAPRSSSGRPKTCTRSPSARSSRSASNVRRGIVAGRQAPSAGSLSVKNTLRQRSCRRSSVTSPSIQTVGSRASQSATPRLKPRRSRPCGRRRGSARPSPSAALICGRAAAGGSAQLQGLSARSDPLLRIPTLRRENARPSPSSWR